MSFLNPPKAPDPTQTSNAQAGYNLQAAQTQQGLNMFNQTNPFGSQTYTSDASSPSGFAANISLSPAQQAILDQLQQTKLMAGGASQSEAGAAGQLASQFGSLYSQPPQIDPSDLTNKMMGWGQQYMQPIFNQQQSNLDAKLQNQGINPGSEAFNNAQNLQSRNVNNAYQSLFLNAEPTAFSQAIQQYQLPMQTAMGLQAGAAGAPGPTTPNSSLVQTPTEQVGAPNYQQAAQNQFQAQQSQYQNLMGGLGSLAGVGLKAAMAPMTGGASLMVPGMFGGGSPSGYGGGW